MKPLMCGTVILSVLTFCASVLAECGWMLWEKKVHTLGSGRSFTEITPYTAFESLDQCRAGKKEVWESTMRVTERIVTNGFSGDRTFRQDDVLTSVTLMDNGETWEYIYLCLPDTVNPNTQVTNG